MLGRVLDALRRAVVLALVAGAGAALGGFSGLVFGAFIGGNFTPDSEVLGLRGYEGAGRLGLVLGAVLGALGGFTLMRRAS